MNYYIDTDLQNSRLFIAPMKQEKGNVFLIEFKERYRADDFLRKLNAGLKKSPLISPKEYEYVESIINSLGMVKVFLVK